MYILKPRKIDEIIIQALLKGETPTTNLLKKVGEIRHKHTGKSTTKQSFYAALRKLKREDIVISLRRVVSLNTTWLDDMRQAFEKADSLYTSGNESSDFLSLTDKESVVYSFSSIKNMDTFWGHTWNIFTRTIPQSEPLCVYDPHYWFSIARQDLERKFRRQISSRGRQFLMSVGGNTALDKFLKKEFSGHHLQYNFDPIFTADNYYLTVIGDYIAETYLDQVTVKKIEGVFKTYKTPDPDAVRELQEVLEAPVRCRLKIIRNARRAAKLKKRMTKNFYVIRS